MSNRHMAFASALLVVALAAQACGDSKDAGPNGPSYDPVIPTTWAGSVTNSFFPLASGTVWEYEGETAEGTETIRVEVLQQTRVINGVTATVVRDRVYLDGELKEDTDDWYAQDTAGNVWYLGETTKEYEAGVVVSTEGSWEWTVDDALPGIIMWADPAAHVNEDYRQEFYEGEAEDWARVDALGQVVDVPQGHLTGCVQTYDWSGLDASARERKYYAPGIGLALEVAVGSGERVELVRVTRP